MSLQHSRADLPYRDDYLLPGELVYVDEIHKLYVERAGVGPPLLLIPGMSGDAGELAPLRDALRHDFATIAIDRRGYSRSPRCWTKCSVDAQADDLARLLDALAIDSAFVFAASSGAAVALKLAMRYPARVDGLLLHEPWVPALLADPDAFAATLADGELRIQEARARRNTGPFEARLRFLMGPGFEALPTEVRGRLVKNGEMHAVESVYSFDWLPPPAALLPAARRGWSVSVGEASLPELAAIGERLTSELAIELLRVPGRHGAYLEDAAAFVAAIEPRLLAWQEPAAAPKGG